jgi:hypothetical protein
MEQSSKVPESLPEKKPPMAKLQQRLFCCAVSCQPAMGTKSNDCASQRRPLGRESVGMGAVYFRSRIPAMALT